MSWLEVLRSLPGALARQLAVGRVRYVLRCLRGLQAASTAVFDRRAGNQA